jgi:hypothetical protein
MPTSPFSKSGAKVVNNSEIKEEKNKKIKITTNNIKKQTLFAVIPNILFIFAD